MDGPAKLYWLTSPSVTLKLITALDQTLPLAPLWPHLLSVKVFGPGAGLRKLLKKFRTFSRTAVKVKMEHATILLKTTDFKRCGLKTDIVSSILSQSKPNWQHFHFYSNRARGSVVWPTGE